jgi:Na+/phosphate symporter
MLVAVHPAVLLENWVFGDFQSLKPSPDEHRIQPIEASQLVHGDAPLWALLPALLCTGAAFGVVMSPLVARATGVVPLAQAGLAGGVVGTVQWLGNALGVAVLGTIYFALAQHSAADAASVSHVLLALLAVGVALLLPRWIAAAPAQSPR